MNDAAGERLIIFTRFPLPGRAKTRLIPALGPLGAAELQGNMTRRVMAWARRLAESRPMEIEVCFDGGSQDQMRRWLGPGVGYARQGEGGLGRRMGRALGRALDQGRRAVLVGCDIPHLTSEVLGQAFSALERADLVLGPAADGGYYLVGLSRPAPGLFQELDWGGPDVLQGTLELAGRLGLGHEFVAELQDVDSPGELKVWRGAPPAPAGCRVPGSISVVIPTLNEEKQISRALASTHLAGGVEVLVSDGGSTDGTVRLAGELGALVIEGPPGRGGQMRAGAEAATGECLVFLHADTALPGGWDREVRDILSRPGNALGAFEFKADQGGLAMGLIEFMVHWRSRLARMPYGDQALFLRAQDLERIGGFPSLPLMEDVELVRRCRRLGRVVISPLKAVCSARRWRERGALANTLRNWSTFAAFQLGASPERLCRRYYDQSPPSEKPSKKTSPPDS